MNTLGVILARAGSKGLPRKHLLEVAGVPLIEHTFAHARASHRLTRVVLSSDCPELRELARRHGIEAIDRPVELAGDDASVQDVLIHACDHAGGAGFDAQAIVTLYGNVPVRPAGLIDRAIELLERTRCDSVRSFCPVGKWHPGWMSRLKGDVVEQLVPGSVHRRQDLEPLFLHDGGVVASSRAALERGRANRNDPHAFFGTDRRGVLTGIGEVVEVDSRRDLLLARAVFDELREQNGAQVV